MINKDKQVTCCFLSTVLKVEIHYLFFIKHTFLKPYFYKDAYRKIKKIHIVKQ